MPKSSNADNSKPKKSLFANRDFILPSAKPVLVMFFPLILGVWTAVLIQRYFDGKGLITTPFDKEPWTNLVFALMNVTLISYFFLMLQRAASRRMHSESSFLDIDRTKQRTSDHSADQQQLIADIKRAMSNKGNESGLEIEDVLDDYLRSRQNEVPAIQQESFAAQMAYARQVLEEKSKIADEKASALLDRGVLYTKFGIVFFIVAIIAWQGLAWWKGFQTQLIFGMVSSAVLFVFLQFLSSWFLKQYRHFVEVSTYLIEIKSVFDRYALLHMLIKESKQGDAAEASALAALVASLKEEMKWPRARPGFTDDVYFAKDAVTGAEEIVKIIRMGSSSKESNTPR